MDGEKIALRKPWRIQENFAMEQRLAISTAADALRIRQPDLEGEELIKAILRGRLEEGSPLEHVPLRAIRFRCLVDDRREARARQRREAMQQRREGQRHVMCSKVLLVS